MKTLEQIKEQYKSKALDGRDLHRLMDFIPEEDLPLFGLELKDEFKGTHEHTELTKEAVLEHLQGDVAFGFKKALDQRGISAGLMYEVVSMWNWILEEGLESFDDYAQYGLPLFKATAKKYGFPNPIGEKAGNEREFACD